MGKLKQSIIYFVVFLVGVGVGSMGSKSSTTGRVPVENEEVKQSTIDSNKPTESIKQIIVENTPKPTIEIGKVEVKSHKKTTEYGYSAIVGEVMNNTQRPASFVKVTATYYDKNNEVAGTDFTYAGDTGSTPLQIGSTTPFKIVDTNKTVFDSYKLDVTWN
jgi:hypothetical protein